MSRPYIELTDQYIVWRTKDVERLLSASPCCNAYVGKSEASNWALVFSEAQGPSLEPKNHVFLSAMIHDICQFDYGFAYRSARRKEAT